MTFEGFSLNHDGWLVQWPSTDLIHHAESMTMTKKTLCIAT